MPIQIDICSAVFNHSIYYALYHTAVGAGMTSIAYVCYVPYLSGSFNWQHLFPYYEHTLLSVLAGYKCQ